MFTVYGVAVWGFDSPGFGGLSEVFTVHGIATGGGGIGFLGFRGGLAEGGAAQAGAAGGELALEVAEIAEVG